MKTCKEMRYENARALADGRPAEFARKLSDVSEKPMSGQQANQIIGPNANRGIGDEIARRIELAYGKEEGWLDHDWNVNSSISGHKTVLSDEAKSLILCVERLDALGELAHKTFTYHTGLLLLSSAATELQTGSVRAQMLEQLEQTRASTHTDSPGATNERKHRK